MCDLAFALANNEMVFVDVFGVQAGGPTSGPMRVQW
jgi:hypothetical protein